MHSYLNARLASDRTPQLGDRTTDLIAHRRLAALWVRSASCRVVSVRVRSHRSVASVAVVTNTARMSLSRLRGGLRACDRVGRVGGRYFGLVGLTAAAQTLHQAWLGWAGGVGVAS